MSYLPTWGSRKLGYLSSKVNRRWGGRADATLRKKKSLALLWFHSAAETP